VENTVALYSHLVECFYSCYEYEVDYLFLMEQSVFSKGEAKWILNLLALNTTKDDAFLFFSFVVIFYEKMPCFSFLSFLLMGRYLAFVFFFFSYGGEDAFLE
jgi:hypothetical protein